MTADEKAREALDMARCVLLDLAEKHDLTIGAIRGVANAISEAARLAWEAGTDPERDDFMRLIRPSWLPKPPGDKPDAE